MSADAPTDGRGEFDSPHPWRDKPTLKKLYYGRKMGCGEIGDLLGCSYSCVIRWMKKHGLERRSNRESQHLATASSHASYSTGVRGYEKWTVGHRGESEYLYVHRLLAVAVYGFSAVCDNDVHHVNQVKWDNRPENITVLSPGEHRTEHNKRQDAPWHDRGRLKDAYQNSTARELAEQWGCDSSTVIRALQKFGIERRGAHPRTDP